MKPPGNTPHAAPEVPDHQLLRCIGRGSYGEVWLARNVTGIYRAIKVVYRAWFDDDRPYEREFTGIKKFEPISRAEEGYVDVLHVGRNDAKGYFYYVMELADDESGSQEVVPEKYFPQTLRSVLQKSGRLPVAECLRIAQSLSTALDHLHKAGLVHRDIKPSNIVFIKGVPKLADIGLVTEAGSGRSFVGTEGYVPPEGPGGVPADVYALGKVLYEMSTGKDRLDYPELPTNLRDFPDRERLTQLNEIIVKACEDDRQSRYPTADAMRSDLARAEHGEAVRPNRSPRVIPWRWIGLGAAATCFAGLMALLVWQMSNDRKADPGRPAAMPFTAVTVVPASAPGPAASTNGPGSLRLIKKLQLPGSYQWLSARLADLAGNGEPMILLPTPDHLLAISHTGKVEKAWQGPAGTRTDIQLTDLLRSPHSPQELPLVCWASNEVVHLSLLNQDLALRQRFSFRGGLLPLDNRLLAQRSNPDRSPRSDTFVHCVEYLETPEKGRRLFAEVTTGYALSPRGMICFDLETGTKIWNYWTAPPPAPLALADLDGDGASEVLLGTYAAGNAKELGDETADDASYLFALNDNGELLWRREFGGYTTRSVPVVVKVGTSSQARLFVMVTRSYEWAPEESGETGWVFSLDASGHTNTSYNAQAELVSWEIASLQAGEPPAILLTDRHGNLHVLGLDLLPKATVAIAPRRYDRVEMYLDAVCDMDGDGRNEIVLHASQKEIVRGKDPSNGIGNIRLFHDNEVVVVGPELTVRDRFLVGRRWEAANHPGFDVKVRKLAPSDPPTVVVFTEDALFLRWTK